MAGLDAFIDHRAQEIEAICDQNYQVLFLPLLLLFSSSELRVVLVT